MKTTALVPFLLTFTVLLACRSRAATVMWIGGNGDWNSLTNWSTGALPGADDDVVIDRTGGDITVTHSSATHSIKSLLSQEPFILSGGTLTVATTLRVNNGVVISGGTLAGGTIMAGTNGQPIIGISPGGTLDGVRLATELEIRYGVVTVVNGLTLANGTVRFNNTINDPQTFSVAMTFNGPQLLGGNGQVVFDGNNQYGSVSVQNGTLTIGPDVVVRSGNYEGRLSGPMLNQGIIRAGTAGRSLNINGAAFTNQGIVQARFGSLIVNGLMGNIGNALVSDGGHLSLAGNFINDRDLSVVDSSLTLQGDWTNAATINATNSTVNLAGVFTLAKLGIVNRNGGTVNVTGTLDGRGETLALNAATGSWNLNGGTLLGSTLTSIEGASLNVTTAGGTLDGVTLATELEIRYGVVRVVNGLTLANGIVRFNNTINDPQTFAVAMIFYGTQMLGGNGQVIFDGNSQIGSLAANGNTLTIGPGVLVRSGSYIGSVTGPLINQGTISAETPGKYLSVSGLVGKAGNVSASNGGQLSLVGNFVIDRDVLIVGSTLSLEGNWTNAASITLNNAALNLRGNWNNVGVISATTSTVNLDGTFTLAKLGIFNRNGGTVNLSGTLSGPGETLALNAATGSWNLNGGTLVGLTLTSVDGEALSVTTIGGALDEVTLATELVIRYGAVTVVNGLTLANGSVRFNNTINDPQSFGAWMVFNGTQLLGGNGEVVFDGNSQYGNLSANDGTLTIGPGVVVRSAGYTGSMNGQLVNQGRILATSGGTINVSGQSFRNEGFLGASAGGVLDAAGSTTVSTGSIEVLGASTITHRGTVQFDGSSFLVSQSSTLFRLSGDLLGNVRVADSFSPRGTTLLDGSGDAVLPQFLEVMSRDTGADPSELNRGFAYGALALGPNTYVRLVDVADNATGTEPEALYVNSLLVPASSTLDLNGLHVYTRALQISGNLIGNTVSQIADGGTITLGNPTSGTISGSGELDEWTFFGRAGQTMTVAVEIGSGNVLAPQLNYAEVRLLDPSANVVARGSNNAPGQVVALTDVLLPSDGTYRIQVRAPASQPSSMGNYLVTVWEITPDVAPLVLNQPLHGRIETPYSVDRWTFSAVAGQQVRFDLVNASAFGVAFTLRGPNGWVGFSNLVNDSGLVALPNSGAYALTAFGTGGAYDIDYAFQLVESVQTELVLGTTFTGQFVGSGQAMLFRVDLSGDRPFQITLQNAGVNNRAELYAGFGLPPTRGTFSHADNQGVGSDRQIVADTAYPGTHYVLVYGDSIGTPGEFTLTVKSADLFVTRLSPSKSGNGGTAIVEIQGAGLQPSAQVRLEGNGVMLPASSVTRVSSTRLVAEFNLAAVASNAYQVVVTQGASSAGLPFEVTGGVGARFEADLVMPGQMGLTTVNTIYVEYQNLGDLPMVAPLLAVRGDGIGEPYFSLNPNEVSRDFWAASQPSFARKTVSFFATGKIPGILMPGESVRVPINLVGVAPTFEAVRSRCIPAGGGRIIGWRLVTEPPPNCRGFGERPIPPVINIHLLQFLPPSALNVGSGQSQPDQPLNWRSLRTNRPPQIDPAAWDAIWMNYTNAAGGTTYSFFGMLQQNVEYLYRLGLLGTSIKNTDDLLAFELAQADGLHMLRTLATATDGNAPTPGLRLSFDRSFPNSISGRYRTGALGRGWSHNWEERLTTNEFGDVTIIGQGGSRRTFKPDVRGGYVPDLGDNGKLVSLPGGAFSLREKGGLVKEFHADGKLNFLSDPNGNRITCGYTGVRLTSLAHSSGQRLGIAYNAQGRIETITDSVGRTTRLTYDPSGEHLAAAEYYDGRILRYQYASGQGPQREHALTRIEFPDQSHQFFTYNPQGRLQAMNRDGGSELVTYAYDNAGTVFAIDAFGHTSKFLFDNRGLLVRMENPRGEVVHMRHDERFNLAGVTDPAGRSFDYTYDRQGNLTEIINPLGHRTQFTYEPQFQRLSQLTDAKGNPTRYNYDHRGNLRGITYADGKSENWGYNGIGNPTTWTNRRRNDINYQFNPTNGFLMAKLYPDGSRADYEYDARGNLIAASNYTGRITLDYFPANDRLQRITYPGNHWLEYTYDAAGRRHTMTDHLGYQLRYDYDAIGRLRSITNSDNLRLVHYQYDAASRMAFKTLGNGVYTTYTYDDANRLEKLTNALPTGSALSFFNYTYDERGRRTAMATHYGAWTYRYDDLGQLTNAVLASTDPQIPNQDLTYLYDAMGNRVRTVENGVVTDYTANNLNQYGLAGGKTFVFDDDGNLLRENTITNTNTFDFNFENQLIGVTKSADASEYSYDSLGNRVATIENGVLTESIIDPSGFGDVVANFNSSGSLISRFSHGLGLVSRSDVTGNVASFTFDAIGNVQELVGATGAIANSYAYAPFGELLRSERQIPNQFEFVGESGVAVEQSDLHFMRNRFYASNTGRFLSQDPIRLASGEDNMYRYAFNSPINAIDPSGLFIGQIGRFNDFYGKISPFFDPASNSGEWLGGIAGGYAGGLAGAKIGTELGAAIGFGIGTVFPGVGNLTGAIVGGYVGGVVGGITGGLAGGAYGGEWGGSIVGGDESGGEAPIGGANFPPPNIDWNNIWDQPDWKPKSTKTLIPIYATDPNQKLALTGLGERGYVQSGALLPYRIDFENDTNATAPAQAVFVTDRLANTLDWPSLELTEIGFGDERIILPPQTQHFETNLPVTINGANFVVQIHAGIRLDTGEVFCTFRSLDPDTDLPPPATAGFLHPENGTGRGQGHLTFVIRPKTGLPTGTEIRNVALVDFDGRETIATDQVDPHNPGLGIDTNKQARVTIDAGAPTSSVTALPSESGHAFWVQLSAKDDLGGSGIASFDLFVSTNGGPFGYWLKDTISTASVFIGDLGNSYQFYSIARDLVGNAEAAPVKHDAQTMVITNAPLLAFVTDQVAAVEAELVVSNRVTSASSESFLWSLGPRAPYGAAINRTNGVLRWKPGCFQGSTTNQIIVWATDRMRTNISDAITITVAVRECVSPQLGRLVLGTGDTGRLPIDLISSVPLTNLSTFVSAPSGRVIPVSVEPVAPEICMSSIENVADSLYLITLTTCSNQFLVGTQQIAWLVVRAPTNQQSAFVPVVIGPSVGTQPDGTFVTNYVTQAGRVVIVDEEPLLEAFHSTNGFVQALLYAPVGSTNILQINRELRPQSAWMPAQQVEMTNLLRTLPPFPATNQTLFFRAVRQ